MGMIPALPVSPQVRRAQLWVELLGVRLNVDRVVKRGYAPITNFVVARSYGIPLGPKPCNGQSLRNFCRFCVCANPYARRRAASSARPAAPACRNLLLETISISSNWIYRWLDRSRPASRLRREATAPVQPRG